MTLDWLCLIQVEDKEKFLFVSQETISWSGVVVWWYMHMTVDTMPGTETNEQTNKLKQNKTSNPIAYRNLG